ncbi:MAG: glycine cleavage system protein GcvH [Planctomycetota bacterium]|jgi:glycine cleavage system H protein|nr:glycine cleavage system protein GcvH [Planctomycetota bacterium]
MNPEQFLYAETHEWVSIDEVDGDKIATIGISAHAVEQLTDLVFMELPEIGSVLESAKEFGEVESVKAVSPLYSPIDGVVTEVNHELPDTLEILNEDPYGAGWIMKAKVTDEDCLAKLMDFSSYKKQCGEEG